MQPFRSTEHHALRLRGALRLRDPFRVTASLMADDDETLHVPPPRDPASATLILEGDEPLTDARLPAVLDQARALGYGAVELRVDPALVARDGVASWLVARGVTRLRCRLLASNPVGYAQLTGVSAAFQAVLLGLRRTLEAGLGLELEAVLLDPRVQEPAQAVELVARLRAATGESTRRPSLAFVLSDTPFGLRGERGLRPVTLAELALRIDAACRQADERGVDLRLPEYGGLPPCLFAALPAAASRASFRAHRERAPRAGRVYGPGCEACAYRRACLGVPEAWAQVRGTSELVPQARRVAGLTGRPHDHRERRWTRREIDAARASDLKVLRLTMRCNQACVFCPSDDTSENIARDLASRLRLLSRWRRAGVRRLSFSGGEPTLDPGLPELVAAASQLGFPIIEVVTNAVRLADPEYARRLIDAGLTQATVSLHSHHAAESDAFTCGRAGDFERTLCGLGHLLAAGSVRVYLNHVVHAGNAAELVPFVRFVADRLQPPPIVTFAALTPLYRALEHPELWPRLADLAGPLKAALDEGTSRGLQMEVLSRPGVPPCILAPDHLSYSDLEGVAAQATSEDAHKKVKAPSCARCRFDAGCGGVWRAYADRFGLDELVPVPAAPVTRG